MESLAASSFRRRADERALGIERRVADKADHLIEVVDAFADGVIAGQLASGRDQLPVAARIAADEAVTRYSVRVSGETDDETGIVDAASVRPDKGVANLESHQEWLKLALALVIVPCCQTKP